MAGALALVTAAERPDLHAPVDVWPEYNRHGDVLNRYWGRLSERFAPFQFVLLDGDDVVAQGHSAPLAWDGDDADLPSGIDGAVERAFSSDRPATALCALAVEIVPEHQGRGLSGELLETMRRLAREHELRELIAPVRPSWKERYPLTPIERYAGWTRADGLPLDPWLRVHARAGGSILRPEPRSLRITGTVDEWQSWTRMLFPESGEYVFPRGLATLAVDREADVGRYWEPNVWVRHAPR